MEKEILDKIMRVYQIRQPGKTAKGEIIRRPYWFGYYQEDGRQIKVYVGRELPKELRRLIARRYRKPGCRNYTWPRPTGMWKGARKPLATQEEIDRLRAAGEPVAALKLANRMKYESHQEEPITVDLKPEIIDRLDSMARSKGISRSDMTAEVIMREVTG